MNWVQGFFSTGNPFLAALFDFWQKGRVLLTTYSFTGHWDPMTANVVGQSDTITIDPSIDFLLCQMNFIAYPTTGVQTTSQATPNILLSLTEKSGATLFSDEDHHVALWAGSTVNGNRSYAFPIPRYIKGNNEILAKLTDNGGTAVEAWLGLEGIRVTYVNASRQEVFPGIAY